MLGVEASKLKITGNLKFDRSPAKEVKGEREQLIRELGILPPSVAWIAGSTHPGEEDIILRVYSRMRKEFPTLSLILAPRSEQRFDEVFSLAQSCGWETARRSQLAAKDAIRVLVDVLVLDTIGELACFYSLGNFAFVGGSLVDFGGHNPLEAVERGLPVVFRPHMENFREIAAILTASGGAFQISDEIELFEQVKAWLIAPATCRDQGKKAQRVLQVHRGAVARSLDVIRGLLERA